MAGARVFRVEFRIAVARRILNGESVSALSNELKTKRSVLYWWRDAYRDQGAGGLSRPKGRPPGAATKAISKTGAELVAADQKIAELERRLGRMALDNYFLRRAFRRVREARSKNNAPGEARCTEKDAAGRQSRTLSILEACDAAGVSRAGFYRHFNEHLPLQADTELRQQIQQICLDHRCYGSRRVIIELQKPGLVVNRKRVMRLMRADKLLCLRSGALCAPLIRVIPTRFTPTSPAIGSRTASTSYGSPISPTSGCGNRSSTWQSF